MKHPNTRIRIDHGTWINQQGQDHQGSVFIEGDRIVAIDQEPEAFEADDVINALGLRLFPGFIDLFSYLPGVNNAEITRETEIQAACAAGFVQLACTPETDPILDSGAKVARIQGTTEGTAAEKLNIKALGAMTQGLQGLQLSNMHALHHNGCIGLSQGLKPFANLLVMRRAFEYAATFDFLYVSVPWLAELSTEGCANESALSTRMGLTGIPEVAESIAVAQQLLMAKAFGLRIHFTAISCKASLELIQNAQASGQKVTADTSIAHLLFHDQFVENFNSLYHIRPPLRTQEDQKALFAAVNQGQLMISSHHKAVESAEKAQPFAASQPGMCLYDTLPATLVALHQRGLSWKALQQALCTLPAGVLGARSPTIEVGQKANVCLLDPHKRWIVNRDTVFSGGDNHPWWHQSVQGANVLTLSNGRWTHGQPRKI